MASPSAVLIDASLRLAEYDKDMKRYTQALSVLTQDSATLDSAPFSYATHIGVLVRHLAEK